MNAAKSGNQIRNLFFNYGPLIGTDRRIEGIKEEGAQANEIERERERDATTCGRNRSISKVRKRHDW